LVAGDSFTITVDDVPGDRTQSSTTYAGLANDVRAGDRILVDDGRLVLEVIAVDGPAIRTRVVVGGTVSDHKGLNLPGVELAVPALSGKDVEDLRWALGLRADLVALSFVRGPDDVDAVRRVMDEVGTRIPVLAKIEKPQAVHRLRDVVEAFDGVLVARGDLGVELPLEDVPIVQKQAVSVARELARPVVVATQMLESMVSSPRPTRAEASDVANAVLDGADAVMLSAETSIGSYPVEAVATMDRIVVATEAHAGDRMPVLHARPTTVGDAIAQAATATATALGAAFLVAFTQTGETARRLARHRCGIPLLAFTPDPAVRNQLALTWGVETFIVPAMTHTDAMVRQVDAALLAVARCRAGDLVCIVFGSPIGRPGSTDTMRLHRIGGD
jgi:pyruvate kinase